MARKKDTHLLQGDAAALRTREGEEFIEPEAMPSVVMENQSPEEKCRKEDGVEEAEPATIKH